MANYDLQKREGDENFFQPQQQSGTVTGDMAVSRQAAEVQAAMIVAKKFPRDEEASYKRIMQACRRMTLAEQALYSYPRGDTTVTGPSIRLAECLIQQWGNADFGIIELEQRASESTVMAYAWDLETNTRQTKVFQVRHERVTKNGRYPLTDPRDVYEMIANNGARRLRACILGIIPGDVVEAAQVQCETTLKTGGGDPIEVRIEKMLAAYDAMGVGKDRIEAKLGHVADKISEQELVNLRKAYSAIRDNFANADEVFPAPKAKEAATTAPADGTAPQQSAPAETNPLAAAVKRRGRPPKSETTAQPAPTTSEPAPAAPKEEPAATTTATAPAAPLEGSAPPDAQEPSSPPPAAAPAATPPAPAAPTAPSDPTVDEVWAKIQKWALAHDGAWPKVCQVKNITNRSVLRTLDKSALWAVLSGVDEEE